MKVLFEWHKLMSRPAGDPVGHKMRLQWYVHCVWFQLPPKEVMKETIRVFKGRTVLVWELSPSTRRSDTHRPTHAALSCLCVQVILKNMALLWRSFRQQGTAPCYKCISAAQPLAEDNVPEVQMNAEDPMKSVKRCRGNRQFLKIQMTEM